MRLQIFVPKLLNLLQSIAASLEIMFRDEFYAILIINSGYFLIIRMLSQMPASFALFA